MQAHMIFRPGDIRFRLGDLRIGLTLDQIEDIARVADESEDGNYEARIYEEMDRQNGPAWDLYSEGKADGMADSREALVHDEIAPWLNDLMVLVDGWERKGAMETFEEIRDKVRALRRRL